MERHAFMGMWILLMRQEKGKSNYRSGMGGLPNGPLIFDFFAGMETCPGAYGKEAFVNEWEGNIKRTNVLYW